METFIDINSDLGESPEALASGADFELMRYITSSPPPTWLAAATPATRTRCGKP